ncbi:MAG: hypothetical protein LBC86_01510 [Oscillospiraceae bacterium]|jgi:hypothetical protein|nr:hypothetical protein [Oscillospiraceae bacterium]
MKKLGSIFILAIVIAAAWWFVRRVLRPIMRFAVNIVLTIFVVIAVFVVFVIIKSKKGGK